MSGVSVEFAGGGRTEGEQGSFANPGFAGTGVLFEAFADAGIVHQAKEGGDVAASA